MKFDERFKIEAESRRLTLLGVIVGLDMRSKWETRVWCEIRSNLWKLPF